MTVGSAHVVGGGIAGLAAAAALARSGWQVVVLEQSAEVREFGAGIYLKENSLQPLDGVGVSQALRASGVKLDEVRIVDETGRPVAVRDVRAERVIVTLRADLHGALLEVATEAGAEIRTTSTVTRAAPDGTLQLADGSSLRSDLVIGADGFRSVVRDSLGLAKHVRTLGDGATRVVVPRGSEEPVSTEYWAARRRVGIAPCSAEDTYVFLIGPESDAAGVRLPVDVGHWSAAFPHLREIFERIPPGAGVHHAHAYVLCHRWVSGRVALLGDAAHAQPPNFGQGAGLAIANAFRLAEILEGAASVGEGLECWHEQAFSVARNVQRLTTWYDHLGYRTPASAAALRAGLVRRLAAFGPTRRRWEWWWRGGVGRPLPPGAPDTLGA